MSSLSEMLQSKQVNVGSGFILATVWASFAYTHLLGFQESHNWALLLFCLSETVAAALYICRSDPKTISVIPFDWLAAIAGTSLPLFLRPAPWGILPSASIIIMAGTFIQILGLISLNRSFALVAAKREIKTDWMYRIVRHPIYASYCLTFTGYVLANTTLSNLLIYVTSIVFLCIRIFREESHLALDPQYRNYMGIVRYRLIPFVF